MGIHKEVRKMFGSSVLNYIISARTAQGYEDSQMSTLEERQDIIMRWKRNKTEFQNPRQNTLDEGPDGQETGHLSPKGFLQTRHLSFDERKKLHEERKAKREAERTKVQSKDGRRSCPFCRRDKPHMHTPRGVQQTPDVSGHSEDTNAEFEQAIHDSVAATSRGDPEEDMMIERAIRASVRELQKSQGSKLTNQEALNRAIQASVAEAGRRSDQAVEPIKMTDEEAEHQALLEKAIQDSLATYQLPPQTDATDDIDTDEDENIKLAIQMSKQKLSASNDDEDEDQDEEIKLAIQKSKDELVKARTDEEIVLEYVKKQSLAEEEHKRAVLGKEKEASSAADEEALKLAIEESLKSGGGSASGSGSGP
jgi:hypothetical protein